MTPLSPDDPFVTLWQTAPKPDTRHLLQDLQRFNRLHQRLNGTVLSILCGFSLLLIFEEATGRVSTHGALSLLWILALVLGAAWRRRARCTRADALALDTVRLLHFMIARSRSDLLIARCLYAGVPCGAVVGFLVVKFAGISGSPPALPAHAGLHLVQTVAGVAALLAMIVAGAILARSRRSQVRDLSEKLKLFQAGL